MFFKLLKDWNGQKAGTQLALADADAVPLVQAGIMETVRDDPLTSVITRGVENALNGFQKGLDGIITATLKRFADAQAQSRRHGNPIIFGENGDGDSKKSFGDWCLAVARNEGSYLEKNYGSHFNQWSQKAAMAESAGATGGYTVPPEFYQRMLTIMAESTFIRPRAFVVPMGSATLMMPYLDITTVQAAGTSPFFGAVKMNWTAEAQTRTETEPAFKQMELRAWELSGYSVSSNVLLQDSIIGLEKFLMMLFAQALAWYEEYAFLQGSGAGKPQGILGANAAIAVTRTGANLVQFLDVATMWSKLLPISWNKAIWTCCSAVSQVAFDGEETRESTHDPTHDSDSSDVGRGGHQLDPAMAGARVAGDDERVRGSRPGKK
jgi:HK97 family phage major capsid protein